MLDGEVWTTVRQMADWVDLAHTTPLVGYAIHHMTVVNDDGVGPACYLQMIDGEGDVTAFLIDPSVASQFGWEIMGVVHGHADVAFTLDSEQVSEQMRAIYDYDDEVDDDEVDE
jgi:hypothetical protein